jgi:hypothetical protein
MRLNFFPDDELLAFQEGLLYTELPDGKNYAKHTSRISAKEWNSCCKIWWNIEGPTECEEVRIR